MLKELHEKKLRLSEESKSIIAKCDEEKRAEMTPEETKRFDALHAEIAVLDENIKRRQRQLELERGEVAQDGDRKATDDRPNYGRSVDAYEVERALRGWFLTGSSADITPDMLRSAERAAVNLTHNQLKFRLPRVGDELRAEHTMQGSDVGDAGGFVVAEQLSSEVDVALKTFGGMRAGARIFRTDAGGSLRWPTVNDTNNKGRIVGQNTTVNRTPVTFNQVIFEDFKYSSDEVIVSVELMQDAGVPLAGLLGELLGTRLGRITNEHFTVGSGNGQPQGLVGAALEGVVSSAAAGTFTVSYDDLVDLEHSVDAAYRNGARWMFHDKTLAALKKLRDGEGRLVWQPGLAVGSPDRILGYPYIVNNEMPEMGADAKSIIFGSLGKYVIRDVRDIELLRLNERYADQHSIAFLAFLRTDGDLIDAGTGPVRYFQNSAA